MKEIEAILCAYEKLQAHGKRAILATVVEVEGSSYRRPGARMLVAEDGCITGAISGGCLEGDALRKALLALQQNKNKLVIYDTTDETGEQIGIQLGCNGLVRILFEPVQIEAPHHPMQLLQGLVAHKQPAALVALFNRDPHAQQPGTSLCYTRNAVQVNPSLPNEMGVKITEDACRVIADEQSFFQRYNDVHPTLMGFVEYVKPPLELVICGAGNDALPLVNMAHALGWHVSVVDGRATHATRARFAHAKHIIIAKPDAILEHAPAGSQTVYMLMTHNYQYDMGALRALVHTDSPYIGILGPRAKTEQMLKDLKRDGTLVSAQQQARLFGPAGLDIGAETAEEIALSIVAEIQSVMTGREAIKLRDRQDAIHERLVAYAC